jgi:hypothetical protein
VLALQGALQAHLKAGELAEPQELRRPLAALPETLGPWSIAPGSGMAPPQAGTPDEVLDRLYVLNEGPLAGLDGQAWMVYSRGGLDRLHHPRICYLVAGYVEEAAGRATLPLEGRPAPVERFGFRRGGSRCHVFYWHYTLESPPAAGLSLVQRIHQRQTHRLPSVTIQVFTSGQTPAQLGTVADLVRRVDAGLQECLPPGARMGSDLLPIRYVGTPRVGRPQ